MVWQPFSRSAVSWQSTILLSPSTMLLSSDQHENNRACSETPQGHPKQCTAFQQPTEKPPCCPCSGVCCLSCRSCATVTSDHPNLFMANSTQAPKMFCVAEFLPSRDPSRNFQECSSRMQTITALVSKQMAAAVCLRNKWPELLRAEPLAALFHREESTLLFTHLLSLFFTEQQEGTWEGRIHCCLAMRCS